MKNKPKTFAELFKGTNIEPQINKDGSITYSFRATKKEDYDTDSDKRNNRT